MARSLRSVPAGAWSLVVLVLIVKYLSYLWVTPFVRRGRQRPWTPASVPEGLLSQRLTGSPRGQPDQRLHRIDRWPPGLGSKDSGNFQSTPEVDVARGVPRECEFSST